MIRVQKRIKPKTHIGKPKILLVNVADPWLRNGGDRPSLGTLYIASWLRHTNAAEPQVIDLNHEGDLGLMRRMGDFQPDIVGVSLTTPQYAEAMRIGRMVKAYGEDVVTIAGGPHVTAMQNVPKVPEVVPEDIFDYAILGPGERTLELICKSEFPNKRIIQGEELPPERSLDWLPMPARDLVDMDRYSLKILGKRAQPMMTSFGCPYKCTFCSEPVLNNRFKAYSPERVVAEMKELRDKYGTEALVIYDDVFSIDAKRAERIAELMMQEGLVMPYRCTTRATDFVRRPKLADKLKASGCVEVCIGLESADDSVLKVNDKGMSVDANRQGLKIVKNSGMRCLTYMITGLPGCNHDTERRSLDFIKETEPDEVGWYLLAPFPSTPLWVNRDKYGLTIYEDEIIANDWDVAQCMADNDALTCYVDYSHSGGLSRHQIKGLWLDMREEVDAWQLSRGRKGIQDADANLMGSAT